MRIRKILPVFLLLTSVSVFSQGRIEKLQYAKTEIQVPDNCTAESEYEIFDCNGFSAQWLFLNDEMAKAYKQLLDQIGEQIEFNSKEQIEFTSQKQKFHGTKYVMKNEEVKIIAYGKVNDIPLILNLGFNKNPKNNSDLTDFEKNFISLF